MTPYENILVEQRGRVGLVTLNRPKQLNALNDALMDELGRALLAFDADDGAGAIVVTGSAKAFAAGADIGNMAKYTYMDVYRAGLIKPRRAKFNVVRAHRQQRSPHVRAVAANRQLTLGSFRSSYSQSRLATHPAMIGFASIPAFAKKPLIAGAGKIHLSRN